MRRLLALTFVAALALPAAASALRLVPGDGTLAVRNGDGEIRLRLRGVVLGKLERGSLRVVDPTVPCADLLVWDADKELEPRVEDGEKTICLFKNKDETPIRFRFLGGEHQLRLKGVNISLSAVGTGRVYLKGTESRRDGTFSLDGERFFSLPKDGKAYDIPPVP